MFKIYIFFFVFSILFVQINSVCSTLQRSGTNQYIADIYVARISQDYKIVVTVDFFGQVKTWTWDGSNFVFKQKYNIQSQFLDNFQGLYLWNNAQRIYAGGNEYLQIHQFNNSTNKFDSSSTFKIKMDADIRSITVNINGSIVYVGTSAVLYKVVYDGSVWRKSIASFASAYTRILNTFLTKDQKKLIFYSSGNQSIVIFKFNGTQFSLDQTISPVTGISNIRLSPDQKVISAYGNKNSFMGFMLNQTLDKFFNITVALPTTFLIADVFMDQNRIFTISKIYSDAAKNGIQTYQFNYINGVPSYTSEFFQPLAQIQMQILPHRKSEFIFVATSYKIYSIICNCNTSIIPYCNVCNQVTSVCYRCFKSFYISSNACRCSQGTYLNSSYCHGCDFGCIDCTWTLACTTCMTGFALTAGKCDSCLVGYYFNSTGYCTPCGIYCDQCSSSIVCQVCSSPYALVRGKCCVVGTETCNVNGTSANCSAKYYLNSNICDSCNQNCYNCINQPSNCTSCTKNVLNVDTFLMGNACIQNCPLGTYTDNHNHLCKNCSVGCTACISIVTCTTCMTGFALTTGKCDTCLIGYFFNANGYCDPCGIYCNQCSNSTFCLNCSTPYAVFGGRCCTVGTTVCNINGTSSSCSSGYYLSTNICTSCTMGCAACIASGLMNCLSCNGNYYKNINSTICSQSCPNGQYIDISGSFPNVCRLCSSQCTKCFDSLSKCLDFNSCITNYYFFDLNSSCLVGCPLQYYISGKKCIKCNQNCYTCFNQPSNCTSCFKNGEDKYTFLYQNICVQSCPQGSFLNNTSRTCINCHQNCMACQGPGQNNCLSCKQFTILKFLLSNDNLCLSSCPQKYYQDQNLDQCIECISHCLSCSFKPQNCTKCGEINSIKYYLFDQDCLLKCPAGYAKNNKSFICQCIVYFVNGTCMSQQCLNVTYTDIKSKKKICKQCSTLKGTCPYNTTQVTLSTKIIKGGQSMEHILYMSQILSLNISSQDLKMQIRIFILKYNNQARLLQNQQKFSLKVKSVKISSDRYYVFVQTQNAVSIYKILSGRVQAKFQNDNLFSQSGVKYNLQTTHYQLSDPLFMKSYFQTYQLNMSYTMLGLFACIIAFLLVTISIIKKSQTCFHQNITLIILVQMIALFRMKKYPLNFQLYTTLLGFSQFQFEIVPNFVYNFFIYQYDKITISSVQFSLGNTNLFNYIGSILIIFVGLQIIWFIMYAIKKQNIISSKRFKLSQQFILIIFMPRIFFSSIIILYALITNCIKLKTFQSWLSIGSAIFFIVSYIAWLVYYLIDHIKCHIYKVHSILRVCCIFLVILSPFAGLITFNALEILFLITDYYFFIKTKICKAFYLVDKFMVIGIIDAVIIIDQTQVLTYILIFSLSAMISIRFYYIYKKYKIDRIQSFSINANNIQTQKDKVRKKFKNNKVQKAANYFLNRKSSIKKQYRQYSLQKANVDDKMDGNSVNIKEDYLSSHRKDRQNVKIGRKSKNKKIKAIDLIPNIMQINQNLRSKLQNLSKELYQYDIPEKTISKQRHRKYQEASNDSIYPINSDDSMSSIKNVNNRSSRSQKIRQKKHKIRQNNQQSIIKYGKKYRKQSQDDDVIDIEENAQF